MPALPFQSNRETLESSHFELVSALGSHQVRVTPSPGRFAEELNEMKLRELLKLPGYGHAEPASGESGLHYRI
jgi:hypothetical protein